ncbi:transposase [Salinibius halmophilus]|uniref:transposase n=1 Tax=Salinibius halmophilus TaxID=1853216 RepID=UPI000E663664|nr:transposase [Salinibius halmophilus]
MTIARKLQINLNITPYYHCVERCVRRSFLCGKDKQTGKSFEHRRSWILDRVRLLASAFCIDVAAYAIMSNHYHLVLHINQAEVDGLTEAEIAARWKLVFVGSKAVDRYLDGNQQVKEIAQATLDTWRKRLSNISWFMKCLNEHIAHKANKEDGCTGHFWEGRFKSQPLLDEKALLAAMVYVDLNPIRAQMAKTVPDSIFTSAYERIHGCSFPGDNYYSSGNQERTNAYTEPHQRSLKPLMNFITPEDNTNQYNFYRTGTLPVTYLAYMDLLDWSSRIVKEGKKGAVDESVPPLLEALDFDHSQWHSVCTELGQAHGALGSSANREKFHRSRGSTRIPRMPRSTKLFG